MKNPMNYQFVINVNWNEHVHLFNLSLGPPYKWRRLKLVFNSLGVLVDVDSLGDEQE